MSKQWKPWTDKEVEILKDNLHLTYKELGNKLDRSVSSAQKKVKDLGLLEERYKLKRAKPLWTDEMITYLKENYSTMLFVEMSAHLGKSKNAICHKAYTLGLKRVGRQYTWWTQEEVAYLEQSYGRIDTEIIARKLGRTVGMIRQKANSLDLFIEHITPNNAKGVKLKCTYMDNGMKKSRSIFYPTERSVKNAAKRAIDSLTNYMKFTDVKVVEVIKL